MCKINGVIQMEKLIETNLKKNKLLQLLDEVESRSDHFSITRYFNDYMSEEEFNNMQQEYLDTIMHEHHQRLNDYDQNIDGYKDEIHKLFYFKSEQEAKEYFNELFNQDMDAYQSIKYIEFENKKPVQLNIPDEYLIQRKITRITPVTIGPVLEVYTFSMDAFSDIKTAMKKLFSQYKVYGGVFEDLCLYHGENIVLRICSHESYAYVDEKDAS